MAYIFTVATVIGFGYGMIDPEKFAEMVMMILAFYFMNEKKNKSKRKISRLSQKSGIKIF